MYNNILVSVCVITYNSAQFVLETLESIKAQTYENLELIVSDDCSTDDTFEICQRWLNSNRTRFQNVLLISTPYNKGIAGNCNNAYSHSHGEWIKGIAGDDILYNDCISSCLEFCINNECEFITAKQTPFLNTINDIVNVDVEKYSIHPFYLRKKINSNEQAFYIAHDYVIDGPTMFLKSSLYKEIGGFNERYPFIEDAVFALMVVSSGKEIVFFSKNTVYYRLNQCSVTHSGNKLFSKAYEHRRLYNKEIRFKYLKWNEKFTENYQYYVCLILDKIGINKKTFFAKSLYYGLLKINIFSYF